MPADMPPSHCSRPTCLRQVPLLTPRVAGSSLS